MQGPVPVVISDVKHRHGRCGWSTTVRGCGYACRTAGMLCPACGQASPTSSLGWRPCCSAGRRSNSSRAQELARRPPQHAWRHQEKAALHHQGHLSQGQACPQLLALAATPACREERHELRAKQLPVVVSKPPNLGQVLQCCWLGSRLGEIAKSRTCAARQAPHCHACCSVPVLTNAGFLLLTGVCYHWCMLACRQVFRAFRGEVCIEAALFPYQVPGPCRCVPLAHNTAHNDSAVLLRRAFRYSAAAGC